MHGASLYSLMLSAQALTVRELRMAAPSLRVTAAILLLAVAASLSLTPAAALSWPLCENGGQVWVTERPRTEPTFPGANLWCAACCGLPS